MSVADLQAFDISELATALGLTDAAAEAVYERCRGIDSSPVREVVPQSCTVTSWLAADAFANLAIRSPSATTVWVGGWAFEPHTAKGKSNSTRARWLVLALALDLEEKLTHRAPAGLDRYELRGLRRCPPLFPAAAVCSSKRVLRPLDEFCLADVLSHGQVPTKLTISWQAPTQRWAGHKVPAEWLVDTIQQPQTHGIDSALKGAIGASSGSGSGSGSHSGGNSGGGTSGAGQQSRTVALPTGIFAAVTPQSELRKGVPYRESGRCDSDVISPETLVTEDPAQHAALTACRPNNEGGGDAPQPAGSGGEFCLRVAKLVDVAASVLHSWTSSLPAGQRIAQLTFNAHGFVAQPRSKASFFGAAGAKPSSASASPSVLPSRGGLPPQPRVDEHLQESGPMQMPAPGPDPDGIPAELVEVSARDIPRLPKPAATGPSSLSASGSSTMRTILHLDLDCYYAQVESKRLGLPPSEPLAVSQWGGLLAVNYAARAFGIKRGMREEEAKSRCPGLHTPHVPLISDGASSSDAAPSQRSHTKVSLEYYRVESQKIFHELERHAPVLERVSIDEVRSLMMPHGPRCAACCPLLTWTLGVRYLSLRILRRSQLAGIY